MTWRAKCSFVGIKEMNLAGPDAEKKFDESIKLK